MNSRMTSRAMNSGKRFGSMQSSGTLQLATNLKDFGSPDGEGMQPHGEFIEKDGPAAYWSNLPNQESLIDNLNENGIPASSSNHGGNHLCNQVLYHALHHAKVSNLIAEMVAAMIG